MGELTPEQAQEVVEAMRYVGKALIPVVEQIGRACASMVEALTMLGANVLVAEAETETWLADQLPGLDTSLLRLHDPE